MVNVHQKALEWLWRDSCSVYVRAEYTDPDTNVTGFREVPLLEDLPCKLSFETSRHRANECADVDENHAAALSQVVKLFLAPDVEIPAGCKIVVRRFRQPDRALAFARSGVAALFDRHQEIPLSLWERWA